LHFENHPTEAEMTEGKVRVEETKERKTWPPTSRHRLVRIQNWELIWGKKREKKAEVEFHIRYP
jgi:hypothetical protein